MTCQTVAIIHMPSASSDSAVAAASQRYWPCRNGFNGPRAHGDSTATAYGDGTFGPTVRPDRNMTSLTGPRVHITLRLDDRCS
ncbi:hypothetical protein GCM10009710_00900 [Aeromicrobium alkaliterrae]|uniref:Uncharacterized protein n=1 Tax=Aeromicrobium alkaliterrae TaxID=302168 RepID=A0ABN2JE47_9ACTN